jgi:uncharacterized membrane protein YphA (DoxX/SURF4 family)
MSQKTQNIILWVLAGLLAFAFFGSGASKLMGADMQVKNFDSWGYPQWLRYPIGVTEILFAIGLLVPSFRSCIVIYGIFVWVLVAIGTHLQAGRCP